MAEVLLRPGIASSDDGLGPRVQGVKASERGEVSSESLSHGSRSLCAG